MIKIIDKELCCGCSACLHICPKSSITFKEDKEGFLYPQVNMETCIDCGLCEKVCPVLNQDDERIPAKVYAAKHKDDEIRMKSSSGGIFTLLAEHVIDDGGVVFGARFNDKWEVIHDYTESKEGLAPFRGSKYVQSYIGNSYKNAESFLKSGRKVMFTGTPCQIAGLKKFLRKEYDNLLAVDFVCHGVPSPMVWRKYMEEETVRQGNSGKNKVLVSSKVSSVVTGVNFRDKSTGWKKYSFVLNFSKASVEGEQNLVSSSIFTENTYMKAFLSNLSLRPSCYYCPTKSGKSGADITIGDFWGIDNSTIGNDDNGFNILLNYNESILILNNDINYICHDIKYEDACLLNNCMLRSVTKPINRDLFMKLCHRLTFGQAYVISTGKSMFWRLLRTIYRRI